jgi:hypothetical protein
MSERLFHTFHKVNHTPLRDLIRLRLTNRLDWKARLASAGFPAPVSELILRTVGKTRLWPLEKVAVADELTAHFQDGLAAGRTVAELIETFGSEASAAKLIRRAKRRCRPLLWHGWIFMLRATAILIAVYAVLAIRFYTGRPVVSVDYVAKINEPILQTPVSDRAWPLWRKAILASSDGTKDGHLVLSDAIDWNEREKTTWQRQREWLTHHPTVAGLAREAAAKPALGFVLGPGQSADDAELGYHYPKNHAADSLFQVLLPDLTLLRRMGFVLDLDGRLAAENRDPARLESDLSALLGLSWQLRDADDFLVTQFVSVSTLKLAVDRLGATLETHPEVLGDRQLIRLAHAFSAPQVAADMINVNGERAFFGDIVQRTYTDDGHGDGHITLRGFELLRQMLGNDYGNPGPRDFALEPVLPVLSASRADLMARYNALMDQSEADYHLPMRKVDPNRVDSQLIAMRTSPLEEARYWPLVWLAPSLSRAQETCEHELGERDGAEVGIALELFRRQHGNYPASLNELTPQFLPEIPADRITGDPVKYRLVDGKPLVYSVGVDRVDDGGKLPGFERPGRRYSAAKWGEAPTAETRGDWILYPLNIDTP